MTPDERQLLSGLFDRINGAASQPRDRDAETFISDRVRAQPYAPYLLSQTVIVQEQALKAAAERIQQLEAQVQQGGAQPQEETSFLGSIGKSLFGTTSSASGVTRSAAPPSGYAQPSQSSGPWGQGGGQGNGYGQGNFAQQGSGFAPAAPQGGGFLKGALGAAAGVAGGVLAADAIRGLFGGHNNPFGIASGGFGGGAFGQPGGETIVNNYYDGNGAQGDSSSLAADDARQDFLQDQSDDFASDNGAADVDNSDDSSFV